MKHNNKDIDGLEAMYTLYGRPKKKRFKRKSKDVEIRPERNWKNRKTKKEKS